MKILAVGSRYFLAANAKDVGDIALRILNERRNLATEEDKLRGFIEYVTEQQDGEQAFDLLQRLYQVQVITPEVV